MAVIVPEVEFLGLLSGSGFAEDALCAHHRDGRSAVRLCPVSTRNTPATAIGYLEQY